MSPSSSINDGPHAQELPIGEDVTVMPAGVRATRAIAFTAAILALVILCVLAAIHARDRFQINHVSGTWMALAERAAAGELYPPLFDGAHTGGTRYMPGVVLLHAGASAITGEFLISGKLVSYGSGALMLALLFIWLRRRIDDAAVALALVMTVAMSEAGALALLGMRGDTLSIALQLAALLVLSRGRHRLPGEKIAGDDGDSEDGDGKDAHSGRASTPAWRCAIAGLVCALALLCKMTALWMPAAIVLWLMWRRRWRELAGFGGAWIVLAGVGVMICNGLSDGRMLAQLRSLSGAGDLQLGAIALTAPERLLDAAARGGPDAWALAPLALLGAFMSAGRRTLRIPQIAMLLGIAGLVILYADPGVDWNHIILLLVLVALGAGELLAGLRESGMRRERRLAGACVAAITVVGISAGIVRLGAPELRRALGWELAGAFDAHALDGIIARNERVLADDPGAPLSLDQRPIVVDPYLLARMDHAEPRARRWVREEIERSGFDALVMTHEIDPASAWFGSVFGPELAQAMLERYELRATAGGYFVYRRR